MCGIVGKYNFSGKNAIDEHVIRKMCSQIIHRGPDDEGFYIKGLIGLGMRRLSIIDLAKGHQPIFNEDKTVIIVYNGETYNFLKLRTLLEEKGHQFSTATDTEVLVHAYEEYGTDFIKYIRGMFAFALWDERKKRLILARDRMGQKPLYYKEKNGILWFCSEIKSMLVDPQVERKVDINALDYYLSFNYIPAPHTMFEGIKKLPPASMLICEKGIIKIEKYWVADNTIEKNMTENECAEHIYDLLSESVKMRLISDVPLGAFLSGGIDSSIVVGLMTEHSNMPVKTFSIGFNEDDFSELQYARQIAEHFSTDHHEYIVTPDVKDLIPKLIWHYNEPVGDSSAIPTYYVSKMTRQFVTVSLSGDGGDELFAGYGKYPIVNRIALAHSLERNARKLITSTILRNNLAFLPFKRFFYRLQLALKYRLSTAEERDFLWISHFDNFCKTSLYSKDLLHLISSDITRKFYDAQISSSINQETLNRINFFDLNCYLPDDLLIKVDIASMANSLEVRCPFLDHKFVEFALSIPNAFKVRNSNTKYILKKAFEKILPKEIIEREKMGFSIPIDKWFRTDLKDFARDTLLNSTSNMNNYFNKKSLTSLLDSHYTEKQNNGSKLWLLINFFLWYEMFIEKFHE